MFFFNLRIILFKGVRKLSEEEKKNAPELKKVVFQLQVYYVAPDGTKAVRVYTKEQELTSDRDQAELNMMDRDVLFANMAQKASYFALESNVKCAKYKTKTSNRMAERRQMQMPQQLISQKACLINMSSSSRAAEMNDIVSNALYSNNKITRSKMN